MFLIDAPALHFEDFPVIPPFSERLHALAKGEKRVAYFYENPDNSTFRYRVYNMIQVLQSKNGYSGSFFTKHDFDYLDKVVDRADVFVVCRSQYSHQLIHTITRAKSKGKIVLFDIDDLVFDIKYTHLIVDTLAQDLNHPKIWDFWFAYIGRLRATLDLCDRVITTNEFLANKIRLSTGKPVSIIPNFINKEQTEVSEKIYLQKKQKAFERNDQFNIGYFSGTPSHNKDFEIISDALLELFKSNPRIVLEVVGYMDIKDPLTQYESRIKRYPIQDFRKLQYNIGQVELNVVPLQDNEFTNCKSELKYFEAGIVGTISVASPVFTYKNAIRDGENGYLAPAHQWLEKIQTVIDNMNSYATMAERAYQESLDRFAWYNQFGCIENVLVG